MDLADTHGHGGNNQGGGHGGAHGSHGDAHGGHGTHAGSKSKETIFVGVVLVLAFFAFMVFSNQSMVFQNLPLLILLAVVLYVFWKFDFLLTLTDYERAVISRFGRVHRVGGPGWTLLLPPFESYEKVDLRTQIIDIPKQDVVTKDGVEVKIAAIIYIKVQNDPTSIVNSIVKVEDYKEASKLYVISEIRDVGGTLTMRELISNVDELNKRIQLALEKIAHGWGVEIESVEIKDIDIPRTVLEAMHEEKAAVQKKLARMENAEAHKAEIDAVKEAAEHLSDKAISYYYIKALEKISEGKSTKIIFPMEISKLASQISGKLGTGEVVTQASEEQLIAKYAPLLALAMKKEVARRKAPRKKKGGKKKAKKK